MSRAAGVLVAFIVNTIALVIVVLATDPADLRGVNIVDALVGLELVLAGGIAGAQSPSGGPRP